MIVLNFGLINGTLYDVILLAEFSMVFGLQFAFMRLVIGGKCGVKKNELEGDRQYSALSFQEIENAEMSENSK